MAGGMFLFAAVDTRAKYLTETLHPLQIVWSRQLGLLLGILVILAVRGVGILRTQHLGLQISRGAMMVGSASIFIYAVSFVPLVDAIAVTFVAPFKRLAVVAVTVDRIKECRKVCQVVAPICPKTSPSGLFIS